MSTLVLGIGNTLLSDEGIGVHVVEHLKQRPDLPPDVTFVDGGTLSFTLAETIAEASNLIVLDAARMGKVPGTVTCLRDAEMDQYLLGSHKSVHEVGLGDLMDIARLSDTLPARRALIGIEPKSLDWGDGPTPELAAAVAPTVQLVLELIREWQG